MTSKSPQQRTTTTQPIIIRNEFNKENQYERREIIGKGAYGEVYKALDLNTNQLVALKTVNLTESEGFPISTLREVIMLRNLNHPNIVKLRDIVIEGKDWTSNKNAKLMLALDYYPHDFSGIINDKEIRLQQAQIKSYTQQLLRAVAYIHSKGVMHRDMKTSNILLSNEGDVKLTDFGLSCFRSMDQNEEYQTLVVTRWYRSPELLLGEKHYDYAVDMWSVGCILAEFMLGYPLFRGANSKDQLRLIFELCGTPDQNGWAEAALLKEWPDMRPTQSSPNLLAKRFSKFANNPVLDLLTKLLCLNPKNRISAAEALEHPWFTTGPVPNKNAGSLPGIPRNELWIKRKTEQQYQQNALQAVAAANPSNGVKRMRSDMSSIQTRPVNSMVANATEPPRKQRRFNAANSNQNHYRIPSHNINPPIRPTIGRPNNG